MNLAFSLQDDKDLRESWFSEPYRIVSLWDLVKFRGAAFIEYCLAC